MPKIFIRGLDRFVTAFECKLCPNSPVFYPKSAHGDHMLRHDGGKWFDESQRYNQTCNKCSQRFHATMAEKKCRRCALAPNVRRKHRLKIGRPKKTIATIRRSKGRPRRDGKAKPGNIVDSRN